MGNDLRIPCWIRIGNPHLDLDIVIKVPWQPNQLDSRWEIGEQIGR
jgi:hypothetical protein